MCISTLQLTRTSWAMAFLEHSTIASPAGLLHTVTVVGIAFPTLAAHCNRVGIVGGSMALAARNQHCPVHHVFVCAYLLGQGTPGQQHLTIAVL